jgi:hypothetical protein
VEKISIQSGKENVSSLQEPGDHSHQITFSFRKSEDSKDNTTSLLVCTVLVDTLSI